MRNASYISSLLLGLLSVFLSSCDPVAESDRYIEMEVVQAKRSVLLEEFTGQDCINCPAAHRIIESLQQQYGDALVSVSIHAGGFAIPEGQYEPALQTFKTPEGDQYADAWSVTEFPMAVVNRQGKALRTDDWAASIHAELERPTSLDIKVSPSVRDGKLDVVTTLSSGTDVDGHLQLWLVEDCIVSYQLDGSEALINYVHNNVYRASVNGVGGQPVKLTRNVENQSSASIALHDRWNLRNLSVVAFVYDKGGVVQVVRKRVEQK